MFLQVYLTCQENHINCEITILNNGANENVLNQGNKHIGLYIVYQH
jgi:hypothetical protein